MQAQRVPDWGANYASQAQAIIDNDDAYSRALDAQEAALEAEFLHAVKTTGMHQPADFAPMVRDYGSKPFATKVVRMRSQTIAEVLADSLDYRAGPEIADVLQVLVAAAKGESVELQASALLQRMAAKWAENNAEVPA